MAQPNRRRDRAQVRNAADKGQVRRAARSVEESDLRLTSAIAAVMQSYTGRIFVWELLRLLNVNASVWADSGQRMAYNAGRQDAGHELLALVMDVDEELYLSMEREARAWQRHQDTDLDASHTASVTDSEGEG